ncbi:MAG TPA: hypothetical protein PLC99_24960 [Verrucomicrobiota bacterium]|nr:hypothetical protein [Verrucomicrobiota bacterium]
MNKNSLKRPRSASLPGRMNLLVGLGLFLSAFSGCVTTYQAHAYTGGYKDVPIDGNTSQVSFYGNANTDRETIELYHLYRCAELTVSLGGDFFLMQDQGADRNFQIRTYGTIVSGETRYSKTARIKMFKGPMPKNDPNAYDAHAILKNLGQRIMR